MTRRKSIKNTIGCLIASVVGTCFALAEKTKYYWPGHYSEKALRNHLAEDKHGFPPSRTDDLTFQECIDLHDHHHTNYLGGKIPFLRGKQIGKTRGRGKVSVTDWDAWIKGKSTRKPQKPPAKPIAKPEPPALKRAEPQPKAPQIVPEEPPKNPDGWQTTPVSRSEYRGHSEKLPFFQRLRNLIK